MRKKVMKKKIPLMTMKKKMKNWKKKNKEKNKKNILHLKLKQPRRPSEKLQSQNLNL